ncbi:MAG TPA: autotransporter-associated beta strand repeat-containing protein [Chthoniobacteraceae bacterium]|nr:autotransporter-associated beta strand repeat-containing protein [Chthoniobacteraceae bacterium]
MKRTPRRLAQYTAFILLSGMLPAVSLADDLFWNGTTSDSWSAGSNWSSGGVPTNADTALFSQSDRRDIVLDILAGTDVRGLVFDRAAQDFTFTGESLGLGASGISVYGAGTQRLDVPLRITTGNAISIHVARGELQLSGAISEDGSGTPGLTKSGNGTWVLSGQSSYTGTTRLNAGATVFDFSTHPADLVNAASSLVLGGGDLVLLNTTGESVSQTFSRTTLASRSLSSVSFSGSGSSTLNLGDTWTREGNSGGILQVHLSSGGRVLAPGLPSQTTHQSTTAIQGFLVVTDTDGVGFGYVRDGEIQRYDAAETLVDNTGNNASLNVRTSGDLTLTSGNRYFQSLEIDTTDGAGSLTFGRDSDYFRLGQKALLMKGGNDYTITNGQVGMESVELLIHQQGTGVLTIAGRIGAKSASLSKGGSGALVLTADSVYTGATAVLEGALWLTGNLTGTGSVVVADQALLGGTGSTNADAQVVVKAGATLAPGTDSVGQFRTGSTVYEGGGRFRLKLQTDGSGEAGTDWDQHRITGVLDLSNLSMDEPMQIDLVSLGGPGLTGEIDGWDGSSPHLWHSFISTTEGFLGTFDSSLFVVDTSRFLNAFDGSFSVALGTDGLSLDLTYQAIPEPSTYALASMVFVGLLGGWWRRKER